MAEGNNPIAFSPEAEALLKSLFTTHSKWMSIDQGEGGQEPEKALTYSRFMLAMSKVPFLAHAEQLHAHELYDHDLAILLLIVKEYRRAKEKHQFWPADPIHAAAIVAEESGELIRAALQLGYEHGSKEDLQKEAIQTGAMCLRLLLNL